MSHEVIENRIRGWVNRPRVSALRGGSRGQRRADQIETIADSDRSSALSWQIEARLCRVAADPIMCGEGIRKGRQYNLPVSMALNPSISARTINNRTGVPLIVGERRGMQENPCEIYGSRHTYNKSQPHKSQCQHPDTSGTILNAEAENALR